MACHHCKIDCPCPCPAASCSTYIIGDIIPLLCLLYQQPQPPFLLAFQTLEPSTQRQAETSHLSLATTAPPPYNNKVQQFSSALTTAHHVLLRQLRARLPRPQQPGQRPLRFLRHTQPPEHALTKLILSQLDFLKLLDRLLLGHDLLIRVALSTQRRKGPMRRATTTTSTNRVQSQ